LEGGVEGTNISLEVAGFAVTVAAAIFAVPPLLTALRDLFSGSQKIREAILRELPNPVPLPIDELSSWRYEEKVAYITSNALDTADLEAKIDAKPKEIHKALISLIRTGKLQTFIYKGIAEAGNPSIPEGTEMRLPLFYKGGLPPSLRSSPTDTEDLIKQLTLEE
jgi:hypothetical protein